jgi:hypothetical protein
MRERGRLLVVPPLIADAMRRPKLTSPVVTTTSDCDDVIG